MNRAHAPIVLGPGSPSRNLAVLVASLLLVAPPCARAEPDAAARKEATQRLADLPKGDAAAAYRLALELDARGHRDLAQAAHRRVVAIDPEHAAARRALGFERVGGRWLSGDDLRRARGFVRSEGRWVLAQEARVPDEGLARLRKAAAGLTSATSSERVRAAGEVGRLGDRRGIPLLVAAWSRSQAGANAPGGHFAQSRQMSYVQDFDVEVA
jgi:hypothetical protein